MWHEPEIEIFLCYAREDEVLLQELEKHLRVLRRQGIINIWNDRNITAGAEWEREIDNHLNTARIILLLVSPDFLDSDYCYSIEMKRAMERHEKGEACVIPIILRPVYWYKTPFSKLQVLPTDGKPVLSSFWRFQEEALYNIVEGIDATIKDIVIKDKAKQFLDKGNMFYEKAQYEEAIAAYEEALQYNPQFFEAYHNKGCTYGSCEQYEEAIIAFDEALKIKPKSFETLRSMGDALLYLKRLEEALKAYEKATGIDPNDSHVNETIQQLSKELNSRNRSSNMLKGILK